MTHPSPDAKEILTEKMLKFIEAFQGNAVAAARAAGYRKPKVVACRLMKNDTIRAEIRRKQMAMSQESGKRLGAQLAFDRSHVLNRRTELPCEKILPHLHTSVMAHCGNMPEKKQSENIP